LIGISLEAVVEVAYYQRPLEVNPPLDQPMGAAALREVLVRKGTDPAGMILDDVPVYPADLRPMKRLDTGKVATSDLNGSYQRIVNRNNRFKELLDLNPLAPFNMKWSPSEIHLNNQKRMLQIAVDGLFDNSACRHPLLVTASRPVLGIQDDLDRFG